MYLIYNNHSSILPIIISKQLDINDAFYEGYKSRILFFFRHVDGWLVILAPFVEDTMFCSIVLLLLLTYKS